MTPNHRSRQCEVYSEQLLELAEGLSASPELESHLRGCTHCSERLGTLRRNVELLRAVPSPDAPDQLYDSIIERLNAPAGPVLYPRLRWVAAAAAAVLIAIGFFNRYQDRSSVVVPDSESTSIALNGYRAPAPSLDDFLAQHASFQNAHTLNAGLNFPAEVASRQGGAH